MVENKKLVPHKHAEVIKAFADGKLIEYKNRYDGQWRAICESPLFMVDGEYRVKPEVAKLKWEHKEFDGDRLRQAYNSILGDSMWNSFNRSANKAVEIALEKGYVMLPDAIAKHTQVDYKKDIEDWGSNALNEAAREFISKQDKHYVLSFSGAVDIKAAILKYLECVEKDAE